MAIRAGFFQKRRNLREDYERITGELVSKDSKINTFTLLAQVGLQKELRKQTKILRANLNGYFS
jgi:hypothetical protein